jgi:hypothetical protein
MGFFSARQQKKRRGEARVPISMPGGDYLAATAYAVFIMLLLTLIACSTVAGSLRPSCACPFSLHSAASLRTTQEPGERASERTQTQT